MARRKPARRSQPKQSARPKKGTKQKLSPLFRSAVEVLEHGLWHYFRSSTTTDMKFAILHVDQAIELFLKEKVRSAGKSIYKNPKETISLWTAYDILENQLSCTIPEKPDLEMLHEERNNIQHKYANPNPDDTAFYMEKAIAFVARFLKDELKKDLTDYLPSEYLEQLLP